LATSKYYTFSLKNDIPPILSLRELIGTCHQW